jgi:hypothetical protein
MLGVAVLLAVLGALFAAQPASAYDIGPIPTLLPNGNMTNYTALSFQWSLEGGKYSQYWFNTSQDTPSAFGLFYSAFLPMSEQISWGWLLFVIWGVVLTCFYLAAPGHPMALIVGVFFGAALSYGMEGYQVWLMGLTLLFLVAGPISNLARGRDI